MSLLTIKKCGTLSCNRVWWLNSTSSISTVFTNGRVLAVTWWAAPLKDMRVNSDHRPIYWMDMIKPPRSRLEVWTRGFKDGAKTIYIYILYYIYIYIIYIIYIILYYIILYYIILYYYYIYIYWNIALLWFRGPKHCIPVLSMRDIWLIKLSKKKSLQQPKMPSHWFHSSCHTPRCGCMCKCHWNPGCQFLDPRSLMGSQFCCFISTLDPRC